MNKGNRVAAAIILVVVVAVVGVFSFNIIPTGYTGVRTKFGQISEETVQNGFNWKIPFVESIQKVDNRQQDITFSNEIWSETADRTTLMFNGVTVSYKINSEKSAWIYANVSDYKDNLVTEELVASAVKSSSKTLTDVDATNRSVIEPLAQENIQASLNDKYGDQVAIITKVVINNVDFEDTYNDKIAEKQNAQLEYEKQQIENAAAVEKAQAKAESKIIEAQAEADANDILEQSLSEEVLKQRVVEKWNGELPSVVGESNSVIDVTGYLVDGE